MEAKRDKTAHPGPHTWDTHRREGKDGPDTREQGNSGNAGRKDVEHPLGGHFWAETAPAFLNTCLSLAKDLRRESDCLSPRSSAHSPPRELQTL